MSICFAIHTSDPNLLACELERVNAQVRLRDDDGRQNAVGIGAYAQDAVLMHRYPSSGAPARLQGLAEHGASESLLYHARALPVGMSLDDNTQPFRFRKWLFAHHGEVVGYRGFKQRLWEELPDHLKRTVRGETDSEIAFASFLHRLRDAGRTDDAALEPTLAVQLLGATARHLEALSRQVVPEGGSSINLVATNQQLLLAARLGTAPLFYRVLTGEPTCALCRLVPASPQNERTVRAHQRRRSVAIASDLVDPAGWTELASGHALAVGAGAEVFEHAF